MALCRNALGQAFGRVSAGDVLRDFKYQFAYSRLDLPIGLEAALPPQLYSWTLMSLYLFLRYRCDFFPATTSALNSFDLFFGTESDFQFAPAWCLASSTIWPM